MPEARVVVYIDATGRSTFTRWFEGLNAEAAAKVTTALYRMRQGNFSNVEGVALTRDFKETILARVQRDGKYREALFTEAINAYLAGDTATGKAILRDLVNATIGF